MAVKRLVISRMDGTETTVSPNLGDTIAFEAMLRKNPRWGSLQENALKMQPFRAWNAGRREGTVTESWEEFLTEVAEVRFEEDATDDDDESGAGELGLDTPMEAPTTY